MKSVSVNVNDLMSNIIVKLSLKGVRRLTWRIWLAAQIFRFGGWVSGVTINVEIGSVEVRRG